MQALIGRFEHSLDAKNRLFAPSRYRDQLAAEGGKHFIVARGLDRCLSLFLPSQWEKYLADLGSQKFDSPAAKRSYMRRFFSSSAEAALDEQGRILIPQALKEYAGLEKDVVIVGSGARAELWDRAALEKSERASQKDFDNISATLDL